MFSEEENPKDRQFTSKQELYGQKNQFEH